MGIAFLLLGLLPLMFLPDLLENGDDADGSVPDTPPTVPPTDDDQLGALGDLLLDPDPTEPDDPDVLLPNDEDDMPDTGDQNPGPLDILLPVDEDDTENPPSDPEGDVLLPVDQIESQADTIWVNFDDDAGLGYSEIEDFQAGQDVLHILIDSSSVVGELDLTVSQTQNGLDSAVYLEQQLVAILKGAPTATIADIIVEIGGIAA